MAVSIQLPKLSSSVQNALWQYARLELLYLSTALMNVALMTPFSLALMGWARYWPVGQFFLWLLLVLLIPFNLLRLMDLLLWSFGRQQVIMALAWLLTWLSASSILLYHSQSLFNFHWVVAFFENIGTRGNQLWVRDVAVALLVLWVWLRGAALRGQEFTVARVGLKLRVGGLITAPFLVWLVAQRLVWSVAPFLLLFFAAGLTAVALIRTEEIAKWEHGRTASLSPRWLGGIFSVILGLISTAGMVTAVVSGQALAVVVSWLAPLWSALALGSASTLTTVAYLTSPLLQLFELLLQQIVIRFGSIFANSNPSQTPYDDTSILTLNDLNLIARRVGLGMKVTIFLIILLVMAFLTWTINYLYKRYKLARRAERLTDVPLPELDSDDNLMQRVLHRLGILRQWRAAASIRHIYRQMCRAAAVSGYPRNQSQTPYEYRQLLGKVWPQHIAEVQLITEAFIKIRYGELPETTSELEAILQAWQRVEAAKPMSLTPSSGSGIRARIQLEKDKK
ncbi:MAG: DUF4129 domain-containing protein [Ardenticatenaceae bacterium]|nr:DUF4129 domain-containing protein [Anaerolineales bacterium]MCB8920693.1 DUF4129 domain-containing protein [Ardenticatenaceae bacterium]MCB8989653.1 DUF4129 domain-containing protein [Ardenticatenaceae bacterium]MCB9002889.1 DUF4129 domain-containing protein [Ardenticatenaceae bacterium]